MEFWQKAKSFAEETAKRSTEAAKGLNSAKISDIVSEASKRSKEIVSEASKRADQIKIEAIKRADQIKSQLPPVSVSALSQLVESSGGGEAKEEEELTEEELGRFGVTEELRDFVKGITIGTFKDFPLQDDSDMSDIPTVSNVRQDLSQWQENHAKLVLLSVKEISKLRYELCPRVMRERKFWRIYFMLVNSHLEPYEKRFMEEEKQRSAEKVVDNVSKETLPVGSTTKTPAVANAQKSNSGTSLASEQDLDVFLLGDAGDSDGPDDGDDAFDDDFDKL